MPLKDNIKTIEPGYIGEEIKFIKRYFDMHGKIRTKKYILNFLNSLQKAILEKRIRKVSNYAKQIVYIQDNLIRVYNSMKDTIQVNIKKERLEEFRIILDSGKVYSPISYIKKYISLQGKEITREKAKYLLDNIDEAITKREIPVNDPYMNKIRMLQNNLTKFLGHKVKLNPLPIQRATLSGWNDALNKHSQESISVELSGGVEGNILPDGIMNSMDFAKLNFKTLGFEGKWLEFIGDPAQNFSVMIFGKPKLGKSHLALDFAGYLARNFGLTLYVANEEKLNRSLQEKVDSVKHRNLIVSGKLPEDLSPYANVFLDSVTYLGLKPDDLRVLRV